MSITVKAICKRFGSFTALDNVSLTAPTGSLVALLGPSGSGKTTLLRIIAGLETPDSGSVCYADDDVTTQSARERNVGFVFQHYALFRHMTVFDNVAFALRVRGWKRDAIRQRVRELLHLVRMEGREQSYPSQLSGGQKQRVALVRALAAQPRVLLLDEPFGALDAKVRQELRHWLRRFHEQLNVTSIFVTHDQEEAFEVSDRIVIMNAGKIEQIGTPAEVFDHPANAFVMDFLGNVNVFHAHIQDGRAVVGNLELPLPEHPSTNANANGNGSTKVYVRPHELTVTRHADLGNGLPARVMHINPAGSVVKVRLMSDEFNLVVNVDISPEQYAEMRLHVGEVVRVAPRRVRVFAPEYNI
jgi:sulfate transport system ATP-binding protein